MRPTLSTNPCVFDGNAENGLETYFENEENRPAWL
jgi:hypothetical protein